MARPKKTTSFEIKEMDLDQAQREFNRKRGRGSKYDDVIAAAEKLGKGKALIIGQVSYSEVTGIRQRIKNYLGEDLKLEATKVDKQKNLYDLLIHREK